MNTRHCENRDCVNPQWDCRTCWFWMRERKEAAEAEVARLRNIVDGHELITTMRYQQVCEERDSLRAEVSRLQTWHSKLATRVWCKDHQPKHDASQIMSPCPTCERDRLRAALEAVEYVDERVHPDGCHYDYCPWCGAREGESHKADCARQRALGKVGDDG